MALAGSSDDEAPSDSKHEEDAVVMADPNSASNELPDTTES